MGGLGCWIIALLFLGVVGMVALYVLKFGAALAVKRDREQHLRIVNEARRRAGKPPLTDADLPPEPPPERDELLEKIFGWFRGNQRGFEVETGETARPAPRPPRAPVETPRTALPMDDTEEESPSERPTPQRVLPVLPADEPGGQKPKSLRAVVLLEKRYRPLSEDKLRALVEKAWGVQLSDDPEAPDFVTYSEVEVEGTLRGASVVQCGGYQFLVNNWDTPYGDTTADLIGQIKEARTRHAVRECRAWRSVDILGECDLEAKDLYALLAKVAAELAGNTTLAVYFPEHHRLYPYNEMSLRALLSEDPLGALASSSFEWVWTMDDTDKELLDAMQIAKARFGEFEEAFASRAITGSGKKSPFFVKAEFSDGVNSEHMWVEVTAIEPGRVLGHLRSSPVNLPNLVQDEEVSVRKTDISDWIATFNGKSIGNFTGAIIEKRHRRRQD